MTRAVFVRRMDVRTWRFGPPHFLGHIEVVAGAAGWSGAHRDAAMARAIEQARQRWRLQIRSCDDVETRNDPRRTCAPPPPSREGNGLR
jgi:hypothetical protein